MHYFKLLLGTLLLVSSTSFAMQEYKETEFTYPAGQSPLEQLPTDVKGIILHHLADAKEYYVINHIRNFMSASKKLRELDSNTKINESLIKFLAQKYPQYSHLDIAALLGTDAACQWIRNKIPQDEALKEASDLVFRNGRIQAIASFLKAFPTNIYKQDTYGWRILDRVIRQMSWTQDKECRESHQRNHDFRSEREVKLFDLLMQTEHDLLEKNASTNKDRCKVIDLPDKDGNTAFMNAVRSICDSSFINKLLSYNPDIYATNIRGETILHILPYYFEATSKTRSDYHGSFNTYVSCIENKEACLETRNKVLDFVLNKDKQRILINQADNDGNTPLIAAMHPLLDYKNYKYSYSDDYSDSLNCLKLELMKQLIKNGADVTIKNNNGENFINYLIKYDRSLPTCLLEILSLIPRHLHYQVLNEPDNEGNISLFNAIQCTELEPSYFEPLLQFGADVNLKNKKGKTPLEVALKKASKEYSFGYISDKYKRAEKWVELLWKYNPENKWELYRKYHPVKFYTAAAGAAAGTGAAAYFGWNFLSKYLPNNSSS